MSHSPKPITAKRGTNFWMPIADEESARAAAKMGGLPVLMIALNVLILAVTVIATPLTNGVWGGVMLMASLLFAVYAFRIRSGHFAAIPLLLILYLMIFLVSSIVSLFTSLAVSGIVGGSASFLLGWIIPILLFLLSASALRGWRWLKRAGVPLTW